MWKRCAKPILSEKAKCILLSSRYFNHKLHKQPTYVVYPRGCSNVVLITEKEIKKQNKPEPPKGSYEKEEKEPENTSETLSWNEVLDKLKETTWNRKTFEWWKFVGERKQVKFLPVLKKKRYLTVSENETGFQALRRIGIVGLNIVKHADPWEEQLPLIRVFWRGVFAYLCGMSPYVRISEYYMTPLHEYADKHVPRFFSLPLKYDPFSRKYKPAEPQFGFFARLFDAAIRVQRMKIQGIWSVTDILNAKHFIKRADTYVKEKWPYVQTDETTFFLDTFVDTICEKLWYENWPVDSKFPFCERNIWTVFTDYATENEFVELLESYIPDTEESNMQACYQQDVDEIALLDLCEVSDHLDHVGMNWSFYKTSFRTSRTFSDPSCPEVYLEVSDIQFKYINKKKFVDPNWIEIKKTIVPRFIHKTRISIPALPIIPSSEERLLEILLPTLLHDEFLLRRRRWFNKVPIFIQDRDCSYFNSSYYGFSRDRMIIYFCDVIRYY